MDSLEGFAEGGDGFMVLSTEEAGFEESFELRCVESIQLCVQVGVGDCGERFRFPY